MTIGPDNNLYLIIGNVMDASDETVVQTNTQNFVNGSKKLDGTYSVYSA